MSGSGVSSRCLLILQRSLAIQLHKVGVATSKTPGGDASMQAEYWMYDSGYLLFQSFLEANLRCFWNASLMEAMKLLQFQGYVAPGVLLVSSSACALEVVRAAWTRNVLMPPNNYVIAVVGDIDDCLVQTLPQGQFTPLPEALCWVILELTSSGQPAVLEKIRTTLGVAFPAMQRPSVEVIYDALAKLSADRKVYQTAQGYFVVTPERRRRDASSQQRRESRQLLMSPDEALTLVHGEMSTTRDGDVTHQSVQTNLADVICGGNANDKILYARVPKRSSSFPTGRLERRHSLRFFGSAKRLSSASRGGSMRHIATKHLPASDSSSSTEYYPSTDSTTTNTASPKKSSLLSRLFRRSKRATSVPPLATFSAQFPPAEWFNQRVVHLHSVGTQTSMAEANNMSESLGRSAVSFATWTDDDGGFSSRANTLPRRQHTSAPSPRRHRSPSSRSSTLPRSSHSLIPHLHPHGSNFSPCKSSATTLSSDRTSQKTSPVPFERSSYLASHRNASPSVRRHSRASYHNGSSSINGNTYQNGGSPTNYQNGNAQTNGNGYVNGNSQLNGNAYQNGNAEYRSSRVSNSPRHASSTSGSSARATPNGSPMKTATMRPAKAQATTTDKPTNKSSITLQFSTNQPPPSTSGSTTTTTTINGSNTKIYVQQQNSPVRSLITFENGINKTKKEYDDILIINEPEKLDKENCAVRGTKEGSTRRQRSKLERPTSLYSPREVMKSGFGQENKIKPEVIRRFPSVESLTCSDITITNSEEGKSNLSSFVNNQSRISEETKTPQNSNHQNHPNLQSPSTQTSSVKTMNNTRKLSNSALSLMGKDGLSFKNVFPSENPFGSKANVTSPDKTFDSTGSFNNLFVPSETENKLSSQNSSSTKTLNEIKDKELCTFPSLSDLSVNFKSIAAQKILQGISINSIDTLVEVNMAAAEKQNNCDVTVHTDFGLV